MIMQVTWLSFVLLRTFRAKYAVSSACADNDHLFIETIKDFPPLPIIVNSVLAQRRPPALCNPTLFCFLLIFGRFYLLLCVLELYYG